MLRMGLRHRLQRFARLAPGVLCAALLLAACAGLDKPNPAPLAANPASVAVRMLWSQPKGVDDAPLDIKADGENALLVSAEGVAFKQAAYDRAFQVLDERAAQFAIDLLGVIEEKTKGNLNAEEDAELKEVLAFLRARFVQIAKLVAAQMQREMIGGADPLGSMGAAGLGAAGMGAPADGIAGTIGRGGVSSGGGKPASPSGLIIPD
jgi:hypothetical protein